MGVTEIESEALKLPFDELQALILRLEDAIAVQVDTEFEKAASAGFFDRLAEEAMQEHRAGETKPLDDLLNDR